MAGPDYIFASIEQGYPEKLESLINLFGRDLTRTWLNARNRLEKEITFGDNPQNERVDKVLTQFEDLWAASADRYIPKAIALGSEYFQGTIGYVAPLPTPIVNSIAKSNQSLFKDSVNYNYSEKLKDKVAKVSESGEVGKALDSLERMVFNYASVLWAIFFEGALRTASQYISIAKLALDGVNNPPPIKVVWHAIGDKDLTCPDCVSMDAGSPYTVEELIQSKTWPKSKNLLCKTNCRCWLTYKQSGDVVTSGALQRASVEVPLTLNIRKVKGDTKDKYLKVLDKLIIPSPQDEIGGLSTLTFMNTLRKDLAGYETMRVRKWYDKLDNIIVRQTDDILEAEGMWFQYNTGRSEILLSVNPDLVDKYIAGNTKAKALITDKIFHEVGHNIFESSSLDFKKFVKKRTSVMRRQMQVRAFDSILERHHAAPLFRSKKLSLSSLTPEQVAIYNKVQAEFKWFEDLVLNGGIDNLYNKALLGGAVERDDLQAVLSVIEKWIGTDVASPYALIDEHEYFAEWYKKYVRSSIVGASLDPKLAAQFQLEFGKYFKRATGTTDTIVLPTLIKIGAKTDIPYGGDISFIASNFKRGSFKKAREVFTSSSKKITTARVQKRINEIIKANPSLQRIEFFEKLQVELVDQAKIGRIAGSIKYSAIYDPVRKKYFINANKWISMSNIERKNILSGVVSGNHWTFLTKGSRDKVFEEFGTYLRRVVIDNLDEFAAQGVDVTLLKSTMARMKHIFETTGTVKGSGVGFSWWTANFTEISRILKEVPDLRGYSIESFRSPQDFFRTWLRLRLAHPESAAHYSSELSKILTTNLTQRELAASLKVKALKEKKRLIAEKLRIKGRLKRKSKGLKE